MFAQNKKVNKLTVKEGRDEVLDIKDVKAQINIIAQSILEICSTQGEQKTPCIKQVASELLTHINDIPLKKITCFPRIRGFFRLKLLTDKLTTALYQAMTILQATNNKNIVIASQIISLLGLEKTPTKVDSELEAELRKISPAPTNFLRRTI